MKPGNSTLHDGHVLVNLTVGEYERLQYLLGVTESPSDSLERRAGRDRRVAGARRRDYNRKYRKVHRKIDGHSKFGRRMGGDRRQFRP